MTRRFGPGEMEFAAFTNSPHRIGPDEIRDGIDRALLDSVATLL